MAHLKIALLSLFILLTYSFTVEQQKQVKAKEQLTTIVKDSNLGFGNQTGAKTTPAQLSTFINAINSASTYFRNYPNDRVGYISDKLNAAYGQGGRYGFSVILSGNKSQWSIFTDGAYASVAPGVDFVFPNASYIFIRDQNTSGRSNFSYNNWGTGFSGMIIDVIKSTILAYDKLQKCICNAKSISIALNQYDGQYWNVFCSEAQDLYGAVFSDNKEYIYIHLNYYGCYYAIYVAS